MKRIDILVTATVISIAAQATAFNKNQTIDYNRTLHRAASTDIDAAFHNPAGVVFMEHNGFFAQIGNQMVFQQRYAKTDQYTNPANPEDPAGEIDDYKGLITAYFFPTLILGYKKQDWAAFFHMGPIGGGAGGLYEDGTPLYDYLASSLAKVADGIQTLLGSDVASYTRDLRFEGTSYALGFSLAGAYKINKHFAIAAGYQFLYSYSRYAGELDNFRFFSSQGEEKTSFFGFIDGNEGLELAYDEKGFGHALIVGLDFQLNDQLNFGLKYEHSFEYQTKMKVHKAERKGNWGYTNGVNEDADALQPAVDALLAGFNDDVKTYAQEPPHLAFGVSYKVIPKLKLELGLIWEANPWNKRNNNEEKYTNHKIFTGLAAEYTIFNGFLVSLGYAFENGTNKVAVRSATNYGNTCHHFGLGGKYEITKNVGIQLSAVYSHFIEAKGDPVGGVGGEKVDYGYDYSVGIGMGLDLKF